MPTRVTRMARLREQLGVGHQLSLLPTMMGSMLNRVIQDERRHFAFYRAQGRARLGHAPPRTRALVRWIFQNFWTAAR